MTEIKWFKLDAHTFDTAELRYLCKADKDGPLYQLCWIKLLCEAAKRGDGGRIYVYKDRYIKPRELAMLIDMPEGVIGDALSLFAELDMIKYDEVSGLVIKNFSDYLGEGYSAREPYDELDAEEELTEPEYEMTEEERKREYNREAKRRSRERKRLQEEAVSRANDSLCPVKDVKEDVKSVKNYVKGEFDSVKNVNDYEIDSVKNVKQNVKKSPKNIFIEENRIEESRIEDKRTEEIRKEENTNNNLSRSLPNVGCGKDSVRSDNGYSTASLREPKEEACDKSSLPLGNGYENEATRLLPQSPAVPAPSRKEPKEGCDKSSLPLGDGYENESLTFKSASHTLASPPPAHAEVKKKENVKNYYGIFNNVCLSTDELTKLRAEFGDTLSELIDDLSCGMESEGKSYNNHFATLLRWGKNSYAPRRRVNSDAAVPVRSAGTDTGGISRGSIGGSRVYGGGNYGGATGANTPDGFAAFSSDGGRAGRADASTEDGFAKFSSERGGYGSSPSSFENTHGIARDKPRTDSAAQADSFYRDGGRAQKKSSYREGFEPIRTLTKEEAEEAFRLALERSSAAVPHVDILLCAPCK